MGCGANTYNINRNYYTCRATNKALNRNEKASHDSFEQKYKRLLGVLTARRITAGTQVFNPST